MEMGFGQFYFQWHFTARCNLRCRHCYQGGNFEEELSLKDLLVIANHLDSVLSAWRKRGRISLTGGEPFCSEDLLFHLVSFFDRSPNIDVISILSNGTLIDYPTARRLASFVHLREVQISLDGGSADTHDAIRGRGAFVRAVNGILALKRAGLAVSIMFTLNRGNMHEIEAVIELARDLDVEGITVERVTQIGNAQRYDLALSQTEVREAYRRVAEKKRELREQSKLTIRTGRPLWCLIDPSLGGVCPVGFACLCVLHEGTVLPCRRLEIPLGNVLRDGIFQIWYTSPVLWELRDRTKRPQLCQCCEFFGKCGGCRAAAFAATGDYLGADPHCWKGTVACERDGT